MHVPRSGRRLIVFLTAPTLLLMAWIGWQAWQLDRDLSAAAEHAQALQAAVTEGDDAAAASALSDLQERSQDAADRADGVSWSVATALPWVGDDAQGVRVISSVLAELSRAGIAPLLTYSVDLESLLPQDGRVDLGAAQRLRAPVTAGRRAFEMADDRMSGEDPAGYVEPLRAKYDELADRISTVFQALDSADTTLALLPTMLGVDGSREYLLVFQNNATIRATGGTPSLAALLTVTDGRIRMRRQADPQEFGPSEQPVLALSRTERKVYGERLGANFLDANLTPDFPRAAALMGARWEQVFDDDLDGVFSVDPVAMSYILGVTGPVVAEGVTLDGGNVVDELLHRAYLRNPAPQDQDAFYRGVSRALFNRVTAGVDDPEGLIKALVRGVDEDRIYVHSFESAEQEVLQGTAVAGALVTDAAQPPQVGVYLNDASGAKMSYYLRHRVEVEATSCEHEVQALSGSARLLSDAPADVGTLPDYVTGAGGAGAEAGAQRVVVRLYGPVDGDVSRVKLDGRPVDARPVSQAGRSVVTVPVSLQPGVPMEVTWQMTTGSGQGDDVQVSVTPGVVAEGRSFVAPSACS